jgi:uncharacterized membrane protein YhaH (DUF805 family)
MNYYFKCLQSYAVFHGRARRSEYWYFVLFDIIFLYAMRIIDGAMNSTLLYDVYILATLIPSVAVSIRRMHDVGKTGWFALVPIYNLVLAFTEGIHGKNEYGADPKENE